MNKITVPENIIKIIEKNTEGLDFGAVTLEIKIHEGMPRFRVIRETSVIHGKTSGGKKKPGAYALENNVTA